ncbi:transposase, partial [Legionella micdadei]
ITEGFHRKMKLIQRRAYGFKNFENYRTQGALLLTISAPVIGKDPNYRTRVRVLCC